MTLDDIWRELPIPGEYDDMDEFDQGRWRGVIERAYEIGVALGEGYSLDEWRGKPR